MAKPVNDKAVIFDMDGVLVDTAAFHKEAWYDLAAKHGLKMSEEFFDQTFGMQNSETFTPDGRWAFVSSPNRRAVFVEGASLPHAHRRGGAYIGRRAGID